MQKPESRTARGRHCHVRAALVVDGHAPTRRILKNILGSAIGVTHVYECTRADEAYQFLQRFRIDLVVSETDLHPYSGVDLMRRIRTGASVCNDLPVIFVSGRLTRTQVESLRDGGANEILIKPVSARALSDRIHSAFALPRPFIREAGFVGPDRRRRAMPYLGDDRRRAPDEFDVLDLVDRV